MWRRAGPRRLQGAIPAERAETVANEAQKLPDGGTEVPSVAVDLGRPQRSLLPRRSVEERRGGHEAVRRGGVPDGPRLRPLQRLQEAGAAPRGPGRALVLLGAHAQGLHPVRGRARRTDRLVPGVARADHHGLPSAQGAAGTPRSRPGAPDARPRRAAHAALEEALGGMFAAAEGQLRPPAAGGEGGRAATLAPQPPGGAARLPRPAPRCCSTTTSPSGCSEARPFGRRPSAGRPLAVAAVVAGRRTQERDDGSGMSDRIECRYHGRDFTRRGDGVVAQADRRTARAQPASRSRRSSAGASAGSSPTTGSRT